jgi:hypothetical protein
MRNDESHSAFRILPSAFSSDTLPPMALFQFVQIVYWLALATWFGGVLFIAVAASSIFKTVRQANPIIPEVLSVNLEGQHATLLAGSIVSDLLNQLGKIEVICGIALVATLIAQVFLIDLSGRNAAATVLRAVLLAAALAASAWHRWMIWPKITRHRAQYIEHADEPEIANPARERFDREHRRSVSLLQVVLFLLLGIILFSANISPRSTGTWPHPVSSEQSRGSTPLFKHHSPA